jgi:preprotein translocase subunit SecG
METLVLTIHILIALGLVITVLLQRSEGGGLGIGGGGGAGGGFMTARGTANLLTRATTILAVGFFSTTITLAIMAGVGKAPMSIVDDVIKETPATPAGPAVPTGK